MDRFSMLPPEVEGDVLQPVWFADPTDLGKHVKASAAPFYQSGNFRYFFSYAPGHYDRGASANTAYHNRTGHWWRGGESAAPAHGYARYAGPCGRVVDHHGIARCSN